MCGLFGAVGKKDKGGVNLAKIKILGLYNISRGKDSCGYYFNNTLKKGADKEKLFDTFIETNVLDEENISNNVFIGHTRHGTFGQSTLENAHPFNINDKLILAHNGTLKNIWELCRKYGINHNAIHVDSLALAHLINKLGFSILHEYTGDAALLMHDTSEPNTMYVYHGASKLWANDALLTSERPMYYLDTKEAIYFSSLDTSLNAIRDDATQLPVKLEHNKVFKVIDGVIDTDNAFKVNREENNVEPSKIYTSHNEWDIKRNKNINCHVNRVFHQVPKDYVNFEEFNQAPFDSDKLDLLFESRPQRCFLDEFSSKEEEFVFYHKNRYRKTDSRSTEITGQFFIDKKGFIFEKGTPETISYYYYNGVRLHNENAFNTILKLADDENSFISRSSVMNFAKEISKFSPYPVCNIGLEADEFQGGAKEIFYLNGILAEKSFTPKFSERSYFYKAGKLMSVKPIKDTDKVFFEKGETEFVNNTLKDKQNKEDNKETIAKEYKIIYPQIVSRYTKYFVKKFANVKEIFDSPGIVLSALEFYMLDLLGVSKLSDLDGDAQSKLGEDLQGFVDFCVNEGLTLYENMTHSYDNYEKYLDLAITEDMCQDLVDKATLIINKVAAPATIIGMNDNVKGLLNY